MSSTSHNGLRRALADMGFSGHEERGFTLIEVLVAMSIFTVIAAGMLTYLFGTSRNWQANQSSADAIDNARIGLNRMTREIRQGSQVTEASSDSVSFVVDFGDGQETITYWFVEGSGSEAGQVLRESSAAGSEAALVEQVDSIKFDYYGSDYRCDSNVDGVVEYSELQSCDEAPMSKIARVDITMRLRSGDTVREFFGQSWLRNRAVS